MHQVFSNLAINACQAMADGGTLFVTFADASVDSGVPLPIEAGDYVRVSLRDEGGGIPEEHMHRVFEPFFSTKEKGRGLGLASCHNIIRRHGGHIQVESEPGKGATFIVHLPGSPYSESSAKDEEQAPLHHDRGRILVMDDEEIVRTVAGRMLERLGFDPSFASHGAEAVRLYSEAMQTGHPFAAVILDMTIPGGMGGKDTASRLLALDSSARLISSSGYSDDAGEITHPPGFHACIPKPYRLETLSSTLREVLRRE
jgi:CheY-like chemotaxis protein